MHVGVSFSPNNQYVVSGSDDNTVRIWDVESGDCIKILKGHTSCVYGVSFSPNNQYVVSGSNDHHQSTSIGMGITNSIGHDILPQTWLYSS